MTTLTIQAADTASAMDQIAERLGQDALILSTTKKDGKVIMRATNDAGLSSLQPAQPPSEFANMFNAGISSSLPGKPRVSADAPAKQTSGNPSATSQTSAAEPIQRAMMQALSLMADRIVQLDSKLSGMMLTGPNGLNAGLQDSTPVQLSRAGYSQNTILRLHSTFADLSYDCGVTSFLDCLAEDLAVQKSESLLQKRVIFVVGATGSGRTTLASKLAASA